ncbi:UNVERIFIED_CONTAM: hypothetical protein PYX00_001115 [Menopon gallinae]|uniref:tRNA-splicing endonuclease subunit Sen54 N-terminal domain-containing protein n=1 Tax=Menopon gallinae TaxID=328185 RepID=A0AAW2ICW5_9NEOP
METRLTAKEVTEYHTKGIPSVPGFGIKYFEPKGSLDEESEINSILNATKELVSYKKVQKLGSLSQAVWHRDIQKAEVTHQVGSYWSSVGHTVDKKLFLFPEEALYLVETGVLELQHGDIPVSIQRAYSLLLEPATDLTEDCYRVYAQLTANGYKVLRHNASNILTKYEKQLQIHKAGIKVKKNVHHGKRKEPITDGSDEMPDLKNIHSLVQQFEDDVPIVHAVVFPDFVSFYNIDQITSPTCE